MSPAATTEATAGPTAVVASSTMGGVGITTTAPATATATTARKPLPTIPPYGPHAIQVENLTFTYQSDNNSSSSNNSHSSSTRSKYVLQNVNLHLAKGSRCLLIGANGSGKSTLMRILAGRHLPRPVVAGGCEGAPVVKVLGLHAFHDTRLNFHRAYLDCDWGMRSIAFVGAAVPLMADIAVRNMMEKLQMEYPDRRNELLDMLGIDLDWRMHQLSDGQRRRVQIFLGLIRPFQVLCLDEITTSLDVVVRQDLLRWLVKESDERGATILYATHIFDGLDDWATHLLYLSDQGTCGWQGAMDDLELYHELKRNHHPAKMLAIAEHWLRGELAERRLKRQREKAMGAAALLEEMDVTDRNQGGYASGRLRTHDEELEDKRKKQGVALARAPAAAPSASPPPVDAPSVPARPGRLSDVMGNRGVLDKVARVAGEE